MRGNMPWWSSAMKKKFFFSHFIRSLQIVCLVLKTTFSSCWKWLYEHNWGIIGNFVVGESVKALEHSIIGSIIFMFLVGIECLSLEYKEPLMWTMHFSSALPKFYVPMKLYTTWHTFWVQWFILWLTCTLPTGLWGQRGWNATEIKFLQVLILIMHTEGMNCDAFKLFFPGWTWPWPMPWMIMG